jgi:hypothetical protein
MMHPQQVSDKINLADRRLHPAHDLQAAEA